MLLSVLLMAQPKGGEAGGSSLGMYAFLGLFIVIFYFFMIRPQQQQAKKQKKFIEDLGKGDKVITLSGIHGSVHKMNEDGTTLMLEISTGSYIKLEKSAISLELSRNLNKVAVEKK